MTSAITYGVDANGAMTGDGLRSFDYDASNRLAKVRILKDGEAASVAYLHNALGQRVFKSDVQVEQTLPREDELGKDFINWLKKQFGWLFTKGNASKTSLGQAFVYADGEVPAWALLGDYDNGSASGKGRTEYIWLPTEDGMAIPVGMVRNNNVYAIQPDHLGTPRIVTDSANKVVWQWPYSGFGNNKPTGVVAAEGTGASASMKGTKTPVELALRFPGQMEDPETGMYYNYFRTYRAGEGRYTQVDPIGLAGGPNGYIYANQTPLAFTDPTGLLVELRCRPADIAAGLVNHCWMKTDTKEAGMNEQASCSRAGNDASGFPFVPVVVSDHSCDKPTIITPLPNVDEACVNRELDIGRALGRFAPPFNSCQTFTQDVIQKCSPSNLNTPYIGYPRPWRRN